MKSGRDTVQLRRWVVVPPGNSLKSLSTGRLVAHEVLPAQAFFTNSLFSFIAPMPSILQSMS